MDETGLYKALGRSVAARRKAMGKTQSDIASKLSLSRASLANIERGNQKVLLHQVYRIAKALELFDVRELIPIECFDFEEENATKLLDISSTDTPFTSEQMGQLERFVSKSMAPSKIGKNTNDK